VWRDRGRESGSLNRWKRQPIYAAGLGSVQLHSRVSDFPVYACFPFYMDSNTISPAKGVLKFTGQIFAK